MKDLLTRFGTEQSGIVTSSEWILGANGKEAKYIFCKRWCITTDIMLSNVVKGFKSSERWQLIGLNEAGDIKIVLPGCAIKAFVSCKNAPAQGDGAHKLYVIK